MADLSIQFHALARELAEFVTECIGRRDIHVLAVNLQPFSPVEINLEECVRLIHHGPTERLAFSEHAPRLNLALPGAFAEENPGLLYLTVGHLTAKGLGQSWLTCRTAGPPVSETWKKIGSRLRRLTKAGALATNPKTGESGPVKSYRYTSGAKRLYDEGVPMLPFAGQTVLKFGALPSEN